MAEPAGGAPERLDSWKAIADYLDRDVATVRRWEKSNGLPVRRVSGGRGRSVFAFRTEIDEWLKGHPVNGNGHSEPITPAPGPDDESLPELRDIPADVRPWSVRRWALATAALVILAAIAWRQWPSNLQAGSVTTELTPAALIARGPDNAERWRYPFPPDAKPIVDTGRADGGVTRLTGSNPGYVVGVAYYQANSDDGKRGGDLTWLDDNGAVRRRFTFADRLEFGAGVYEAPWVVADYRLHPSLGADRIAVASHHMHWWPSVVTLLDDRWQRVQSFVNAGWVERIVWLPGDRALIAGFNNALNGGMVALLDTKAMNGTSPSTGNPTFECASCGTDAPIRYVVLPRSEVNAVTATTFNRAIVETTENRIIIRTIEERRLEGQASEALYEFSPELELRSASYGDRYWDTHRALELTGKLDHPRERCAGRNGPPHIEVWDRATGWQKIRR